MRLTKLITAALGGTALLAATAASAQQGQQGEEEQPNWVKVCNEDPNNDNRELCLTSQELRNEQGRFVASAAIREIEGQEEKSFIMAMPHGLLLQPGVRVQIDSNQQMEGAYAICFPNACYAEMEIDEGFINTLKGGTELGITAVNQQGEGVRFPMTLMGFTDAYEGEPIDADELEAQQQRLQSEMQRRADEARQRLLQQQEGSN